MPYLINTVTLAAVPVEVRRPERVAVLIPIADGCGWRVVTCGATRLPAKKLPFEPVADPKVVTAFARKVTEEPGVISMLALNAIGSVPLGVVSVVVRVM